MLLTGFFGGYSTEESNLTQPELPAARLMAEAVAARPSRSSSRRSTPTAPAQVLRAAGVPVHRDVDRACVVLAGLVQVESPGLALPLPDPAPPVADTSYDAARVLFAEAGVAFPAAVSVSDGAGLEAALDTIGFPVVLKATGSCTSPMRAAWWSASRTGRPPARRTRISSTGWPRRRCRSRRWQTSPTASR